VPGDEAAVLVELGETAVVEQLASAGDAAPIDVPAAAEPVAVEPVAATPGADALGAPAGADDDTGSDDEPNRFAHIEALEALDPTRGAEAEVADPPEVATEPVTDVDTETDTPSDNGADAASGAGADDRRAAS
jgi:hypothetical protein